MSNDKVSYDVVDAKGKKVDSIDLNPSVFGIATNNRLVHGVVVWQLAKRRAGTHSALTRGAMKGGGKKPWKQKGSGRARAGTSTSPVWVGGGVAHGPQPRSYETRLSKRSRRQALASVLSEKVRNKKLVILDELSIPSGKTKDAASILSSIGATKGATIVLDAGDAAATVKRASQNIPKTEAIPAPGVNVYDVLRHQYLVCTKEGIAALEQRICGGGVADGNA